MWTEVSMFNFTMNKNAVAVCKVLQDRGFQACLVGGCVRDMLMGKTPHDWDIATSAVPNEVVDMFVQTYPTGIQHGTISTMFEGELFEITTFRTESGYSDGRHPDKVEFVSSITDDLARRDLTINAIAYDPIHNVLIDPFHGHDDIKNKIIRAVGNPMERFEEDGLRIMRVARFASRLQFEVDDATRVCMKAAIDTLKKVSMERIKDELSKTLDTAKPSIGLELLFNSEVFDIICPAIKEEREKFEALFTNLDNHPTKLKPATETKLTYLIHKVPNKEALLQKMKFSSKEIEKVTFICAMFDAYMHNSKFFGTDNNYFERRFLANIKNNSNDPYPESLEQVLCYLFLWDPVEMKKVSDIHFHFTSETWGRKDLVIKGGDVMTLGVSPGPMIKTVLNAAYTQILTYPEQNNREVLMDFAKVFIEKEKP